MNEELHRTLTKFILAFEQVFDKDWEYTKEQLGIQAGYYISFDGTFINPKVDDETEDWGYRGALLEEYRKLKQLLS